MLIARIDSGVISQKKGIELLQRTGKDKFYHFLFFSVYNLWIKETYLHATFVETSNLTYLLSSLTLLLIVRVQHI